MSAKHEAILRKGLERAIATLSRPGLPHEYDGAGIHRTPCRACAILQELRAALAEGTP